MNTGKLDRIALEEGHALRREMAHVRLHDGYDPDEDYDQRLARRLVARLQQEAEPTRAMFQVIGTAVLKSQKHHDGYFIPQGDEDRICELFYKQLKFHFGPAQPAQSAMHQRMLDALKAAREWLSGWASAEPYLSQIERVIADAEAQPAQSQVVKDSLTTQQPAQSAEVPAELKDDGTWNEQRDWDYALGWNHCREAMLAAAPARPVGETES